MNEKKIENPPAFPQAVEWMPGSTLSGMTLRDHFAGQAMQALIAQPNASYKGSRIPVLAYAMADAMLEARMQSQENKTETV